MDRGHYTRGIQNRICSHPPGQIYSIASPNQSRKVLSNSQGHSPSTCFQGHPRGPSSGTGTGGVLHLLHSSKTQRRLEGHTGPQVHKQAHRTPSFPDGNTQIHSRSSPRRGVPNIPGLHRSVPTHTNIQGPQKIPPFQLRGTTLSVQAATIWSLYRTPTVYQNPGEPSGATQTGGLTSASIS